VVLARTDLCTREQRARAGARLVGVGMSGPSAPADSVASCLAAAGCRPEAIDRVYLSADGPTSAELEQRALAGLGAAAQGVRVVRPALVLGASEAMDAVALAAAYGAVAREGEQASCGVALALAASEDAGAVAALLVRATCERG